uniref:Uncharacterized protein n=1 Tax=Arundo donax TaxID=35708 RepID=A0A0A8ZSR7_ARUDO
MSAGFCLVDYLPSPLHF